MNKVNNVQSQLLTVYEDSDMLAVLIALFHWNPRTAMQVAADVGVSQDIVKKKLMALVNGGLVSKSEDEYRISEFGQLFVKSFGVTREEIDKAVRKAN